MTFEVGIFCLEYDGTYAGITHDNKHLFVHGVQLRTDTKYAYAALWADAHAGFRLPTRRETALLYANLQDCFADMWYWTSDQYPADKECMWVQTFGYGRQADLRKTDGAYTCLVRTVPCS